MLMPFARRVTNRVFSEGLGKKTIFILQGKVCVRNSIQISMAESLNRSWALFDTRYFQMRAARMRVERMLPPSPSSLSESVNLAVFLFLCRVCAYHVPFLILQPIE